MVDMGKAKKTSQIGDFATERAPLIVDGESGKPLPTPPARRRAKHIRLRTVDDVRAEAERVYRDARNGKIEPHEGTRLTYMLAQITTMIELGDIERRLTLIENSQQSEG